MAKTNLQDYICYCTGTTEAKVRELIANGNDTLEKIAYETGATTGCAACEFSIMELIEEVKTIESAD